MIDQCSYIHNLLSSCQIKKPEKNLGLKYICMNLYHVYKNDRYSSIIHLHVQHLWVYYKLTM